eukprot:11568113-Karenia_brevis.AAC.1
MINTTPFQGAGRSDDTSSKSGGSSSEEESDDQQSDEDFGEFMRRCTEIAESAAKDAKVSDWVCEQRRRYFGLAGHTARRTDGRWSKKAMLWQPLDGSRLQGHPLKRWLDDVVQFCRKEAPQENWIDIAANRDRWSQLAKKFASQAEK